MYWISRYLDPWPWPIFHAPVTFTHFTSTFHYHWAVWYEKSVLKIAIRGNGIGLEYMCPTRHFVYIFFNPVFQVSTAKNEINLFNNHVLIVAPVTFAPAGAMTPSAEFLFLIIIINLQGFFCCCFFVVFFFFVVVFLSLSWFICKWNQLLKHVIFMWQPLAEILKMATHQNWCIGMCGLIFAATKLLHFISHPVGWVQWLANITAIDEHHHKSSNYRKA